MKKFATVVAAIALSLTMGVTAFAITPSTRIDQIPSGSDVSSNSRVKIEDVSMYQWLLMKSYSAAEIADWMGAYLGAGEKAEIVDVFTMQRIGRLDTGANITLTDVNDVKAGDKVFVAQWITDGEWWYPTIIEATATADGTVVFRAPASMAYNYQNTETLVRDGDAGQSVLFAVIKVTGGTTTAASTGSTTGTSPKTGETAPVAAVAVMLVSAAGIVLLNRKNLA